jgi:hypothetical protein
VKKQQNKKVLFFCLIALFSNGRAKYLMPSIFSEFWSNIYSEKDGFFGGSRERKPFQNHQHKILVKGDQRRCGYDKKR